MLFPVETVVNAIAHTHMGGFMPLRDIVGWIEGAVDFVQEVGFTVVAHYLIADVVSAPVSFKTAR
jgi:hypothetical protein